MKILRWMRLNIAFGRGVRITEKSARQIGEAFDAYGIQKAYMRLILSIWLQRKSRKSKLLKILRAGMPSGTVDGCQASDLSSRGTGKMEENRL